MEDFINRKDVLNATSKWCREGLLPLVESCEKCQLTEMCNVYKPIMDAPKASVIPVEELKTIRDKTTDERIRKLFDSVIERYDTTWRTKLV